MSSRACDWFFFITSQGLGQLIGTQRSWNQISAHFGRFMIDRSFFFKQLQLVNLLGQVCRSISGMVYVAGFSDSSERLETNGRYIYIYRERITCTSICNHLKNTDIVTSLILPILPSSTLFWLRFFFLNTTSAFPFSHTLPRTQDSSGVKIQDGGEAVQSSLTPRKNNDNFCH